MSISTQISRIQADRNTIRDKLVELGMATSTDNLTVLAEAISDLINQGAVSIELREGESYAIPAGYHNGSGTVMAVAGGGNYTLQAKSVTPTKKQQSVAPDSGYYGLSSVTVAAIPDAYQNVANVTAEAGDVLTGKIYVTAAGAEITGTMPNNGAVSKKLTATELSYTIPKGYHNGSGTVSITLVNKTFTPSKQEQSVSGAFGTVTVKAIPSEYISTEDATAAEENILAGKTAYVGGEKLTGTMPNNGSAAESLDGLNTMYVDIPAGYTTGGRVSITGDIEAALAAI